LFPSDAVANCTLFEGIKTLFENSLPSAIHDSAAQEAAAESLPRTRHGNLVGELAYWAQDTHTPFSSIWVTGPKSNLAHLCVAELENHLAASFFFPRRGEFEGGDDPRPRSFFTTIAYQLSILLPAYRELLELKIHRDPGLVHKALPVQFRELISRPFQELSERGEALDSQRNIIIVEGLEEYKSVQALSVLLRILTASDARQPPFRWVVFSRADGAVDAQISGLRCTTILDKGGQRLMARGTGMRRLLQEDLHMAVIRLGGSEIYSVSKISHLAVPFFFFYLPEHRVPIFTPER
jgi:hypothetical protein